MPLRDMLRTLFGETAGSSAVGRAGRRAGRGGIADGHASRTYSQEGEDAILRAVFRGQETGLYVDVGAHHPFRFSNTAVFYESGWSGLNIDATPGSMELFRRHRPRDVNVEAAVSDRPGRLTYHLFDEPALNTFDADYADSLLRIEGSPYRLERTVELETVTLASLLGRHLPAGRPIDFLSIDVENHDLDVLRSNDWSRFLPAVLLVEILPGRSTAVQSFVESLGYGLIAHTRLTGIFAHAGSRFAARGLS